MQFQKKIGNYSFKPLFNTIQIVKYFRSHFGTIDALNDRHAFVNRRFILIDPKVTRR